MVKYDFNRLVSSISIQFKFQLINIFKAKVIIAKSYIAHI